MNRPKIKSLQQLQSQVDAFNASNPVGTPVNVKMDNGVMLPARTRSEAWVMGGHSAVVSVVGIAGGYSLDRVTKI